ncbi:MAG: hypothetical protein ACI81L_001371 [Verrucomicrobiales bacterium]|jgi:hypothetical protein
MNLEDRLRSHMHSGEDLFVESGRNASDISSAGHRRTRRNQVGGAVAGGVMVFGLVAGAVAISGTGTDGDNFAAKPQATAADVVPEDGFDESTASAEAPLASDDALNLPQLQSADDMGLLPDDVASDSQFFDGPLPPFETVVGVGDGFAGLRDTNGVITAIRSEDGQQWTEAATSGIPERAMFVAITHEDGIFAVVFSRFSNAQELWIGTSSDLENWTVASLEGSEGLEVFVTSVDIHEGQVIAPAVALNEQAESVEEAVSAARLYSGPPGGPYGAAELPVENPGQIVGSNGAIVVGDEGSLIRSTNGTTWDSVSGGGAGDFWSLVGTNEVIVALDFDNMVRESTNGGANWSIVDLPGGPSTQRSSVTAIAGGSTVAVFVSTSDDEGLVHSYVINIRRAGAWSAIDLTGAFEPGVFVSPVAVNDEEAIIQLFDEAPAELPNYLAVPFN